MERRKKRIRKKKKRSALNVIPIKINSKLQHQFNLVNSSTYNINIFAKGCINVIDEFFSENKISSEALVHELSLCDIYSFQHDKKASFTINDGDLENFKQECQLRGLSIVDCIKKLILLRVKRYYITVEENSLIDNLNKKTSSLGKSSFPLWCNQDELIAFCDLYKKDYSSDGIGDSLNDILAKTIKLCDSNREELVEDLYSSDANYNEADYKYNFSVANKRYINFINSCKKLGLSPSDCVRKSMSVYINKNKKSHEESI